MCGLPSFPVTDHTIMMNFIEILYLHYFTTYKNNHIAV